MVPAGYFDDMPEPKIRKRQISRKIIRMVTEVPVPGAITAAPPSWSHFTTQQQHQQQPGDFAPRQTVLNFTRGFRKMTDNEHGQYTTPHGATTTANENQLVQNANSKEEEKEPWKSSETNPFMKKP